LTPFARKWDKLGLDDEDLRALEILVMAAPDRYPIVRAAAGLRKMRYARRESNLGKRESFRVCYVYFPTYRIVVLITIFAKKDQSDLNDADRKEITRIIKLIEDELQRGMIK
jgi:hypothetical protein